MKTSLPPDLLPYQEALTDLFAVFEDVCLAVLYGSHARGQAGPLSDVDVGVLLERTCDPERYFDRRLDLIGRLMQALNTNEVDVVILNQAPLALQYRVARDGIVLYYQHHDHMIDYVSQTVSRYLDFKPVIERHERAILQRARQGELLNGYNPHRGALAQRVAGAECRVRRSVIANSVNALKELQRLTFDDFAVDHILNASAERHFQVAIQAALDIGGILLANLSPTVPANYIDIFLQLADVGVLPLDFAQKIVGMAKFRNVLVHLYLEVDLQKVYYYLQNDLKDFELYMRYVSNYLAGLEKP